MLFLTHKLIVAMYLVAPVAALAIDFRRSRKEGTASSGLMVTISVAVLIGVGLCFVYSRAVGGRLLIGQVLLAIYFAAGLLLILKAFDYGMRILSARLLKRAENSKHPVLWGMADGASGLLRSALLVGIGLPYVMAAVMTYRPKVGPGDDPKSQMGFSFERVSFRASDGTSLSGWWIPAIRKSGSEESDRTVIVCHGLGASKSNQLILARPFVPYGYNVLIFDFRAHGESAGQLSSMGDLERRDVLAAVRWLRENRAAQSQRIYGVGASMGGAALIAAAADPAPEGRAIEAVAVFDTFDSLPKLVQSLARDRFPQPLRWLVENLALPMASVQVGTPLTRFAPADLAQQVWPRPIMVIHGTRDEIITFNHGQMLFNSMVQPKQRLWIDGADHNSVINDDNAANRVRRFFQSAESVPVI